MSPFLTPGGWQEEKWVYWKVSVGSKCVRIVFFFFFRAANKKKRIFITKPQLKSYLQSTYCYKKSN